MAVDGEEDLISSLTLRSRSKLSSSFRLGRSRSSALFSDSIPSESGRFTAYERLSESMRLAGEPDPRRKTENKRKKSAAWGFLYKVFSIRKSGEVAGGDPAVEEEKRRRKFGSSWLPDRNRRWPVQGWG